MTIVKIELSDDIALAARDDHDDIEALRRKIQKVIDSGPGIPADQMFAAALRRIDEIERENKAR